jgi:flagellar hook-associated protein 2
MSSVEFGDIRFDDTGSAKLSSKVLGVNVEDILDGLKQAQRIPILKKESQIETNTKKLGALSELETAMTTLQSAVQKLRDPGLLSSTDDVFKSKAAYITSASLSNPSGVIGISAATGAETGTFEMKVLQVATTDQRVSAQQTSKTDDFVSADGTLALNGVNISLSKDMSLQEVADAVNASTTTSKVKAQVLELSSGNFRLVLSGTDTGDVIDMTGSSASVASDLNFSVLQQTSQGFTAGATPVTSAGNLTINGVDVALDTADTLDDMVEKINAAGITNIKASVYETSDGKQHLLINSTNSNTNVAVDAGAIATDLGLSTNRLDEQLAAKIEYNGLTATRSTNTFSDLIPGLTFDVYQAAPNDTIKVSVENDLGTSKSAIVEMVDAYNTLVDLIDTHQAISKDGEVSEDAILYGNSLLRSIDQQMAGLIGGGVKGQAAGSGKPTSLADIGIKLGTDKKLTVDDTILDNALLTQFEDVRSIFSYVAKSSNPNFVSISRPTTIDPSVAGQTVDVVMRNRGEARSTTVNDPNAPLGIEMDVLAADNVLTFDISALDAVFGKGQSAGLSVGQTVQMTDANDPENYFVAKITAVTDTDGITDGTVKLKVVGKSNENATGPITDWNLSLDKPEVLLNFSGNVSSSSDLNATVSSASKDFTLIATGTTESLILDSDTGYGVGDELRIEDQANPGGRYMDVRVTGYDESTKKLSYTVLNRVGTGLATNLDVKRQGTSLDLSAPGFGTSEHTITVQGGKSYAEGDKIEIAYGGDEDGTFITARVSSYDSQTGKLAFVVEDYNDDAGLGTYNNWNVRGYNGTIENNIIRGDGALDGFVFGYEGDDVAPGSIGAKTTFTITQGIADQIGAFMEKMLDVSTGSFAAEKEGLTTKNSKLTDQISRLEDSVTSYMDRLSAQFLSAESQIAVLNSTLSSLKAYSTASTSNN